MPEAADAARSREETAGGAVAKSGDLRAKMVSRERRAMSSSDKRAPSDLGTASVSSISVVREEELAEPGRLSQPDSYPAALLRSIKSERLDGSRGVLPTEVGEVGNSSGNFRGGHTGRQGRGDSSKEFTNCGGGCFHDGGDASDTAFGCS